MTSSDSFLGFLQETPYSVCELDVDSVEPLDTVHTYPHDNSPYSIQFLLKPSWKYYTFFQDRTQ